MKRGYDMSHELSMSELESELCTELPERQLMRHRRRHHGGTSAHAAYGSGAAANSTHQVNFNPQIVINNGNHSGGSFVTSHNSNHNTTNQNVLPINFGN
jgi:hypothetical protein